MSGPTDWILPYIKTTFFLMQKASGHNVKNQTTVLNSKVLEGLLWALLEGFEVPWKIRFVIRGFSRVCANPVQDMDSHGNIRLLVTVL